MALFLIYTFRIKCRFYTKSVRLLYAQYYQSTRFFSD